MRLARHSALGPDALPRAVWSASRWGVDLYIMGCSGVGPVWAGAVRECERRRSFPPKNITCIIELRDQECIRSFENVRFLGLRNCDLKLTSSIVNQAIRPALQALAPPVQR
eukprot:853664-Pyramimonas_sp.AAC.1